MSYTPPEITPDVAHALGHYVYVYIDPRDQAIFYIGKGVGTRATDHLSELGLSSKVTRIQELIAANIPPRIDIVAHGLRDDLEAIRVEAALIEVVGLDKLTNAVGGLFSIEYPRRPLIDLIHEKAARQVEVIDPSLLIRINKLFEYGSDAGKLYDSTRGIWVIGDERRQKARLAMAVYAGVVREVYEIESWHRAGSTEYKFRNQLEMAAEQDRRWEFVGRIAPEPFRSRYLGGHVGRLFRLGQQSPVVLAGV